MAQRTTTKTSRSRAGKPASKSTGKKASKRKGTRTAKSAAKSSAAAAAQSQATKSASAARSNSATTRQSPSTKQPEQAQQPEPISPASNGGTNLDREWPGPQLRRSIGVALLGLAGAGRFTSGQEQVVPGPGGELPAEPVMDVALGAVDVGLEAAERVANSLRRRLNPILTAALAPAAAPAAGLSGMGMGLLQRVTEPLAERGRRLRADSEHEAAAAVAGVLPETIELVMEQIDLTQVAIDNVDIRRVLEATVAQVDMTQFAIDAMDLPRVVGASLDAVDLTDIAIDRIDFSRTVPEVLDQVDVFGLARDQVDPARLAAFIRDNVDLTESIKIDPTAVAGDAVRGVTKRARRIVGAGNDE